MEVFPTKSELEIMSVWAKVYSNPFAQDRHLTSVDGMPLTIARNGAGLHGPFLFFIRGDGVDWAIHSADVPLVNGIESMVFERTPVSAARCSEATYPPFVLGSSGPFRGDISLLAYAVVLEIEY